MAEDGAAIFCAAAATEEVIFMDRRSEEDRQEKAAAQAAVGRGEAVALEEDVFAKQEKLFTDGTSEMPS